MSVRVCTYGYHWNRREPLNVGQNPMTLNVMDLTQRQRKEDDEVKKEVEKKNSEMEENEAKNFIWKVVGSRGARRMMKVRREEERARLRSQAK